MTPVICLCETPPVKIWWPGSPAQHAPTSVCTITAMPALVHDYLVVMRGAERAFAAIADCFPSSPIYTLLYDPAATARRFEGRSIQTSYLQHTRVGQVGFRRLLPLYPRAVERLPVQHHRLVLSSSSAFAHGVRPGEQAVHVCYCYTPFRYAWHERDRALAEVPRPVRPVLMRRLAAIRRWDVAAAQRVTHFIAISRLARQRIGDFWGREASVVHPPVETHRFRIAAPEDFFLAVGEVVPHKRIEQALEAARRAGRRLKVVGTGPDLDRLSTLYAGTAEFLGRISDAELADLYARARALVVPSVEEFGIAAVEAQAAGRPVVAAAAGGALDTVHDGETGVLVRPDDVDGLAQALRYTDFDRFSPARIAQHADSFSTPVFQRRYLAELARLTGSADRVEEPAKVPLHA
jgi:glycosyltransferase involved in cell wall biosynthesis